ncbi:cysteine proteinase inhibitor-like protein [Trifolium pratense]|uniref:Cysteine proteinase inhibitor n=1 Tax=Trifolium pratense TaxID=57577 RepID=A0A2K3MFR8_TRIPR|nr:cysteine proteinase inhibitor-like protein [Trifolium pratense]
MDTTDMKKLEMEEEDEEEEILGGIFEVEGSQSDPTINSLARFAVDQHSKKENAIVEFVKVVNAKIQDVAGVLYYITLEAKVGEKVNVYEAKIWEQSWLDLKELTEFKLVGDAPSVDSGKKA